MAISLSGGKEGRKTRESGTSTQTNTLSDRAAGLLTGGINDLRGRQYRELDPAAIARFQDPYQADVRDATMAQLGQDRSLAFNQLDDRLARSGAFGDKRRGIQEAEVAGQFDRTAASTLAGLNSAGYGQALSAAMTENQGFNNFDIATQDLITRLLSQFGNEGTQTGATTGTSRTSGYSVGGSFNPFGRG